LHELDRGRGGETPTLLADVDHNELTHARLAAVVASCPDPIIGETLDGIITDWNPAAERLYGYSAAEAIGLPLAILTPVGREHEVAEFLARIRRGESTEAVETVRRAKDGRLIDVSLTIFPVRNAAGEIIGASATTRDITERKMAEAALAVAHQESQDVLEQISRLTLELSASEQKYRALVEQLPAVVYLTAADEMETPIYFSPYLEELVGISPEQALRRPPGETWLDYVHPDDRDRVSELNRRSDEEGLLFRAEYRTVRSDGSYIWIRENSVPIYDAEGQIVAYQGVLLDISDHIAAEEAQARLAAIVESADDAIASLTLDGIITSWNRGAEQLYGYHADEIVGKPFTILLVEDDGSDYPEQFAQFNDQPTLFEARRRREDGSIIDVAIALSPIRDRSGAVIGISSITRDVTERKRAEEALHVALEEARAATQAKSQFMAILSHELRTPLQAVLGYAEYLLNDPTATLTAEQREDVGYIHQGAMRMVTLIEQMLDLSRMEAGRLTLNIADVDLAEIIEQVRQDVAPQAEARGLALTVSVASDLPPVRADADRLRQILLNLAGNAVKFTDEGSVTISAVAEPNGVDVAVSDTGIGIAPDAVSRIFEEFQQIDSPQTRRHGGAGLGLAIARGLAERMDGRISVTSEPGVGSTFTLHLPSRESGVGSRKSMTVSEAAEWGHAGDGEFPRFAASVDRASHRQRISGDARRSSEPRPLKAIRRQSTGGGGTHEIPYGPGLRRCWP
jgi:two-component system sensor histidine kinase/response regulator